MDWLTGGQAGEAKRLVKQLADPAKCEGAAHSLIQLGADAVPALIEALGTNDSFLSANASRTLVQIGHQAVPPCSLAAFSHGSLHFWLHSIQSQCPSASSLSVLTPMHEGDVVLSRRSSALFSWTCQGYNTNKKFSKLCDAQ